MLRRYATALRSPIGDHDEIVRDTLLQAMNEKSAFSPEHDIKLWLLRVLHQVYSTQYGNRMPTSSVIPLDITFDVNVTDPASSSDDDIDIVDLEYALALLPETHKEVFLLVSLEGLTYKQISSILDIPVGTLMTQLTHARKLIKSVVSEESK